MSTKVLWEEKVVDSVLRAPFKPVEFLSRDVRLDRRPDGTLLLRSNHKLKPYERHVPAFLARWAAAAPERIWLAQRRGPAREWLKVTYGEAKGQVDAVTQALLDRGFGPEKPIMILSSNSIEFALLTMAGMQARAPVAPVSPAYSILSQDHAKLRYVFDLIRPGLVFVQNGEIYAGALAALDLAGVTVVHVDKAPPQTQSLPWSELVSTRPTAAVAQSIAAIEPGTIGKFLFTSGSTGMPKAVINTQEMMCANIAMGQMARTRHPDEPPPVNLDWLPWNHTMGGNATFQGNLAEGGTTWIDDGKPLPGLFEETLRNLREISPTSFANVPAGYAMLATALEKDDLLAERFFRNLNSLAYGGATLPHDLYERMEALAVRHTGYRLPFITGWGATETAPTATSVHWASERVGLIGLPYPGVQLKLVPTGEDGRYEVRLRSVIVTPGYYKRPDLTAAAFDEEGFYKIGDAARFVDSHDPNQGLIFDGRVVEDFKLTSGTFVLVGTLRANAIAAASPVLQDAVVCAPDREYVGLLGFPNIAACRRIAGDTGSALTIAQLLEHPAVIEMLKGGLARMNAEGRGSSMQVRRVMLMEEPPSVDGHEITDKGYINQRATLERRKALVERLYRGGADVIEIN
ncbi:feruloyl-CoA synthase [Enhydrobacter aerosaccus]|uniref:Feruloyl-CoA synthase n=1 Tax=Enhydrobacter aerosaccus TaxID=225324 RepID=A0A1T4MVV4_9HYPH|nr:AMP-binding protein [Enhydrobacter aerosaccus]SJZ70768.1 feruloyl-CoA synthase [Enhydrobacter aerosaccus]